MYDLQTDAAFACFDPNIINTIHNNNNNNNINNNIDNNNNNNFNNSDNNNNISLQQIDSNSMALDFQNPNNEYNDWTVTDNNNNNRDTVSHEMGYTQFDETTVHQTTTTTDLLTLLHLPRCTFASSSTSSPPPPPPGLAAFLGEMKPSIHMNMMHHEGIPQPPPPPPPGSYDPLFHLNLPPQPSPLLRDLMFHGYPANSGVPLRGGTNNNNCPSSLFAQMDDPESGGTNMNPMSMNMNFNGIPGMYAENGGDQQQQQHMMMMSSENGVFEFTSGASLDNEGKLVKSPKGFVTEKQRRQNFNSKYNLLKLLIPTPTKADRASIVHDAIAYINELKRTVSDLKLLVQKKRISNDRVKRLKTEENNPSDDPENKSSHGPDGPVGVVKPDPDDALVGQLRSSWLQRKCKDTEIDVRIVDDEVTIKLVQRKKMNCLLSVSRTLDDLQLDLRHVAGGHVGDYYSYLFNSKICEGSSVYASAIANKLIDVVERQYAAASVAVAPTTSF